MYFLVLFAFLDYVSSLAVCFSLLSGLGCRVAGELYGVCNILFMVYSCAGGSLQLGDFGRFNKEVKRWLYEVLFAKFRRPHSGFKFRVYEFRASCLLGMLSESQLRVKVMFFGVECSRC